MSERITQQEIDHEARNQERIHPSDFPDTIMGYVEMLDAVVAPLTVAGGSGDHVVTLREAGESVDRFTKQGYRLAEHVHGLARDAAWHVFDNTGHMSPSEPGHDTLDDLSYDAAKALAVVSAALSSIGTEPEPCAVTGGIRQILRRLKERCESEEVVGASDLAAEEAHA